MPTHDPFGRNKQLDPKTFSGWLLFLARMYRPMPIVRWKERKNAWLHNLDHAHKSTYTIVQRHDGIRKDQIMLSALRAEVRRRTVSWMLYRMRLGCSRILALTFRSAGLAEKSRQQNSTFKSPGKKTEL